MFSFRNTKTIFQNEKPILFFCYCALSYSYALVATEKLTNPLIAEVALAIMEVSPNTEMKTLPAITEKKVVVN